MGSFPYEGKSLFDYHFSLRFQLLSEALLIHFIPFNSFYVSRTAVTPGEGSPGTLFFLTERYPLKYICLSLPPCSIPAGEHSPEDAVILDGELTTYSLGKIFINKFFVRRDCIWK